MENCYVIEALRRGAMAYVTKAASSDELSMAQALSPRESEVLGLIVDGKRNGEIAELLNVSAKTVSTHRTRILEKMNLTTNQQIVRYVLQQRLQPSQ